MKKNIYFLLLLFFAISCSEKPPLSGKLDNFSDDWQPNVYLVQPRSLDELATSFAGVVLDSATITADGAFVFEKMPEMALPALLELVVQKKGVRFLNKLDNEDWSAANYFPIVWTGTENLEITADINHFQNTFSIKNPAAENAALLELRNIRKQAFDHFLSKKKEYGDAIIEQAEALRHFRQPLMEFAQNTPHLLPALAAIRWVSPENDYERVPEFLVTQCEKWQTRNANHPWVAQLCQKGNRSRLPVLKGDKIPDFPLPMLSGDTTNLYELKGKQLTVLDLWASWCAPCRHENRDFLVPLWDQYHATGLQIVGYALDSSERAWKRAIETDGADRWLHASHLRGDDAPLLERLRIQTIPANFLLDAEGKVIAKNLHGEELVKFIEKYFE